MENALLGAGDELKLSSGGDMMLLQVWIILKCCGQNYFHFHTETLSVLL